LGYDFPYLIDAKQRAARDFGAVCTPDLFLFDGQRKLFYHGQLDDNWRREELVNKHNLQEAIRLVLLGKEPPKDQPPSIGCSIKWL
jgi:hypothetical protein